MNNDEATPGGSFPRPVTAEEQARLSSADGVHARSFFGSAVELKALSAMAASKGYTRTWNMLGTEDGEIRGCWLEWSDAALERQGFKVTPEFYFERATAAPPAFPFGAFTTELDIPQIAAVASRGYVWDTWAGYQDEAIRLTGGDKRIVPPERIPELQARSAALWQRAEWGTRRLREQPEVQPWLRVAWREVDVAIEARRALGDFKGCIDRRAEWERLRAAIGGGARITHVLEHADYFFNTIGAASLFARAQLSGLAYILHKREPIIERLVEVRDALDIVEPLLNAAVHGHPVLTEEEFRAIQAKKDASRQGGPGEEVGRDYWAFQRYAREHDIDAPAGKAILQASAARHGVCVTDRQLYNYRDAWNECDAEMDESEVLQRVTALADHLPEAVKRKVKSSLRHLPE